ncbi:60S ribosomal protein L18a-like protein [Oryza brachyantha]|uniref:60S ribosomal protein L18a-like protein n=1 Tax=Oryza brachyantha TaxID=4533 RepID=UPI001ADA1B34|nr:60S ribosomal protein L18a-like protein [Oryza brachyantha]
MTCRNREPQKIIPVSLVSPGRNYPRRGGRLKIPDETHEQTFPHRAMAGEMPDADGKPSSASSGFPPSAPPQPPQHQYGTFGAPPPATGELPQPAVGFPQPAPPPGFRHYPPPPPASYAVYPPPQTYTAAAPYYAQGYQAVQGYIPVVEGRPVRMQRLPCCGLGMGWFLFIIGFFLAAIPWYVGAFVLICVRVHDYREKPGYVACTIAALLAAIAVLLGLTKGEDIW